MSIEGLRRIVKSIEGVVELGIDPFGESFLRSRQSLYVRTMDTSSLHFVNYTQCLVEYIVGNLLSEDERNLAYPSPYDLGSKKKIELEDAGISRVYSHLSKKYEKNPKFLVRSIKTNIEDWTGHSFDVFEKNDFNVATKVLCSLYDFRVRIYSHIPSLLERPLVSGKYSSEFRTGFPFCSKGESTDKAREIVAVVADLKSMMTFQMGDAFNSLKKIFLHSQLSFESRYFLPVSCIAKGFRPMLDKTLENLTALLPRGCGKSPNRLDVELYVYLSLLEIEHKLLATEALISFLKTDETIPSIQSLCLGREWLFPDSDYSDEIIFRLLAEISAVVVVDVEERQKYWDYSSMILALRVDFYEEISLVERFAALICVAGGGVREIQYPIWWKGQKTVSFRPWYYLKEAVEAASGLSVEDRINVIPYGYREFWCQRYYLILHRCLEVEGVWKDCNETQGEEIRLFLEMFRSNDINSAVFYAQNYIDEKEINSKIQTEKVIG